MKCSSHLGRAVALAAALTVVCPAPGAAQFQRCEPASPSTSVLDRRTAELPVDRIADLLALEPGVTALNQGDLSVRGAGPDGTALYLDGVPITPGRRAGSAIAGGSWLGTVGRGLALGTNGFEQVTLFRGLAPAEWGNGRGGELLVTTAGACAADTARRPALRAGLASDAMLGKKNGLGFNRITLDGSRRVGPLVLGGAAVLEGESSERLGLEQNASPVFVAAGVDTTVTVTTGAGVAAVDVLRFAPSPGIRIPSSATSRYTLQGRIGYELAAGQRVELAGYASQAQDRVFDYENLYNPRMLRGTRAWSRVVTGSWFGGLRKADALSLTGEAHLSWQTDRSVSGPLSTAGEADTRDPFGGFLLPPFDFRFDFSDFPVNDELVYNFRTNTGRLSPYDLTSTIQYQPIDQWRNNAYGLTGFSESGGPVGTLTLSRETRLVGKAVLDAAVGSHHHARAGLEYTHYDISYYTSGLTSQVNSDAYVQSPNHLALFGDYTLTAAGLTVSAGLRYDHIRSGALRNSFPRISSLPGFDPAHPTDSMVPDRAHGRVSPGIRARFDATPALALYGAVGSVAQLPDFALLYQGINTDLSVTNTGSPFGTDLGLQYATQGDLGGRYRLGGATALEADVWTRQDHDLPALVLTSQFDPLRRQNTDILRWRSSGEVKATGVDLRLRRALGPHGQAWIGYAYTDVTTKVTGVNGLTSGSTPYDRPHTVSAALLYQTGAGPAGLGGVLRNLGVYADARVASGTAYTRCPVDVPEDDNTLSGGLCSRRIEGNLIGSRLPTLKLVDLRVTRGFNLGGAQLVAFADVRNLFNARSVLRVFTQTGTTSNTSSRSGFERGQLDEMANEASTNGVFGANGDIDLSFGGAADPRASCGGWTNASGVNATPNCVYLLAAESRWGNGDHIFTQAEQTRAADAYYNVGFGLQNFTGPGRRVRLGLEVHL